MHLIVSSPTGRVAVPVTLVDLGDPAGAKAMQRWHREIQLPFIDRAPPGAQVRADVGWNWPRNVPFINRFIAVSQKRSFGFALLARTITGAPVTVALAVGIQPFDCLRFSDGRRPLDGFVWYVTGIPSSAAAHLGLPGVRVTAQAISICKSICKGVVVNAEIALHADTGGPALLQFYGKKCMMNPLPSSVVIRAPLRRVNDGRYFYSGSP